MIGKDCSNATFGKYRTTLDHSISFLNWKYERTDIEISKIGIYPVVNATVIKEYDEKKDAANYSADGKLYSAKPGTFFIFFPSDAHRPNITPWDNKPDKKIVIKVRAAGKSDL